MLVKRSIGEKFFDLFNILFMVLAMIVTLYPLLFVLFASLSEPQAVFESKGLLLFVKNPTVKAYGMVFENPNILNGFKNTLLYVLLGTTINIVITSMGGYVLSRKKLLWGKTMMLLIIITMYMNGGLIPLFLVVKKLGMINTIWAMIIPGAISTWNLIIMRTSFMGLPDSLEESAKIDGANDIHIFVSIILPLSKPILAVMTLFYAVGHWNSWFSATIYLTHRSRFPLQVFLREILLLNIDPTNLVETNDLDALQTKTLVKYAVTIVATVPILVIYPFLQKYFVKGVLVGAIKG